MRFLAKIEVGNCGKWILGGAASLLYVEKLSDAVAKVEY